jgi:hypothetical protein
MPANLRGVIAIAAGGYHNLVLKEDTTVVAWGDDFYGQSTVPSKLSGVVTVAAGTAHSLALKADGTVIAWGRNEQGQSTVPMGLNGVVAIAAGYNHSLALKGDGTIVAWGNNTYDQIRVPNLNGVIAIAAGWYHSLALTRAGTVAVWGDNGGGQREVPANLNGVIAIAAGNAHNLALKGDGTVVAWGANLAGASTVPANLGGVIAIAAGGFHNLALKEDGVRLFANGWRLHTHLVSVRGSIQIEMLGPFDSSTILFTLDGSDPSAAARLYEGPFVVKKSATLRAIAYNADFTQSVQSDPLEITILPTLSVTTAGGGSVAMDPPSGAYLSNGTAMVTATPAPGWTFLQWLGDVTGTNPVATVSMSRNRCVQAIFGTGLSNTVVGSGSVARSPATELYPYGTAVRITAVPQVGNYFALWGNAASGTNNPLTFTVTNANPTITAVFAALPANRHALTVLPDGFGSVSTSPRANRYGTGTNVVLTALPDAGQSFLGWSGDAGGSQNPLTVMVSSNKVITAQFTKRPALAPMLCGHTANGEEIQLLLTGEFGERYSIDATASLELPPATTAWTTLATVTNSFGTVQFNDPFATNGTQRFYRIRQPVQ